MGGDEDDFAIAPDHDSRRWWWILAAVVLAVTLIGGSAWALMHRSGDQVRVRSKPPAIEPAQPTTGAALPETSPTPSATGTAGPGEQTSTVPGGTGATSTTVTPSRPKRPPYMAFRWNGTVYLAREDGARAVPIVKTAGVFALSPDARSLAYVDPTKGTFAIVDFSKSTTTTVGPALQVTPEWAPDSSSVLAVRDVPGAHGSEVFRVRRSNGAAAAISVGSRAAVSPDGSIVALLPGGSTQSPDGLTLERDGRFWRYIKAPGAILDVALASDRAYVATTRMTPDRGSEGVWELPFEGGSRLMSGSQDAGQPGDYGMLTLSDSGEYLAYAHIGDDGRSRAYTVRVSRGAPVPVGLRRDDYPLWWAADSSALYAIEGNSWQGEQTALVRVTPDGHSKVVIVQGADR